MMKSEKPIIINSRGGRSAIERWALASTVLVALISGSSAQSATVAFSFTVEGAATTTREPSPADPSVPEAFNGSGLFVPFGPAVYTDVGTLTLGFFPPSAFGVQSITSNFVVSFNEGADTFFGTSIDTFTAPDQTGAQRNTGALTITGGTGIFAGATGSATAAGLTNPPPAPISFSGNGQITAPALIATPEPGTRTGTAFCLALICALAGRMRRAVRKLAYEP